MKRILLLLITVMVISGLYAGWDMPKPNFNPYGQNSSLLSADRLSMNHSMGFSAGTSSDGTGYYLSRYTNHLKYKFNPKLELDLDLNFVNFGGMNTDSKFSLQDNNSSKIIPEFSLRYKPNDNFMIQVHMQQNSGLYPWSMNPREDW